MGSLLIFVSASIIYFKPEEKLSYEKIIKTDFKWFKNFFFKKKQCIFFWIFNRILFSFIIFIIIRILKIKFIIIFKRIITSRATIRDSPPIPK